MKITLLIVGIFISDSWVVVKIQQGVVLILQKILDVAINSLEDTRCSN